MALGLVDARDVYKRGLLVKEGGPQAMDHYFHQVAREGRPSPAPRALEAHPGERSDR